MKRSKILLAKREKFIKQYVTDNSHKKMNDIISELVDRLFISERTIYNILKNTS